MPQPVEVDGVLAATGEVPLPPEPTLFLGELSLDGTLRHTTGVLPLVALWVAPVFFLMGLQGLIGWAISGSLAGAVIGGTGGAVMVAFTVLFLYPLKILVAGGFGVGKTTMVGAVSEIRPLRTEEVLTEAGRPVDDTDGTSW